MLRTVIPNVALTFCPTLKCAHKLCVQNCSDFQKKRSPNLSLHRGRIRESCSVRNYEMPLVPRRVIPHIVFQEILHKLQLIVPQFVLLVIEYGKCWQHTCLCNHAVLLVVALQCMRQILTTEGQQHINKQPI